MADQEESIRKLRALAQASAEKLMIKELGPNYGATPPAAEGAAAVPQKRPRLAADAPPSFPGGVFPGPPPGPAPAGLPLPPPLAGPPLAGPPFAGLAPTALAGPVPAAQPAPFTVVKVPDCLIGLLIGKGGAGLKHLEAENNVRITVGKLVDEGGTRRVCIEGDITRQGKARDMINHFVMMREAQDAAKQVMTQQVTMTEILQVPERFVGLMIGRHGETINRVKDHFGVEMNFDKDTVGDVRALTIRGPGSFVEKAKEQAETMLLQFHRKDGIFNRALEAKYGHLTSTPGPPPPPSFPPGPESLAPVMQASLQAAPPLSPSGAGFPAPPPLCTAPAEGLLPQPPPPPLALCPGQPQAAPMHGPFPPEAADVSAQWIAHEAARREELQMWAAYYARDDSCVDYYLQLRAEAAQAASGVTLGGA